MIDGLIPRPEVHALILLYTVIALALGFGVFKKYNHEFLYYV